jgi:hypothetical protein
MAACAVIGAAVAGHYLWSMDVYPPAASIRAGHIVYTGEPRISLATGVSYLIATAGALLLSSRRAVALLGAIVLAGSVIAYLFYWEAFASVWCFFAAAGSAVLVVHFERLRRVERAAIPGA